MIGARRVLLWLLLLTLAPGALAEAFDYGLEARRIADGVYVFEGRREGFARENGGNIVNTGFIVGSQGVIVIDSGPSRRYGEQMRAAIARVTPLPVVKLLITHAHPDHFLGNQAFADVPIAALAATRAQITESGDDLAENLYHLLGGWMSGTVAVAPSQTVTAGTVEYGGRTLQLIALNGHTGADLLVLDQVSGCLFAGDLVFLDRAPTTPNARLDAWHSALAQIRRLQFAQLVPGHGPVEPGLRGVEQTDRYLDWLQRSLDEGAARGVSMPELLKLQAPAEIAALAEWQVELARSIVHLYPAIETASLPVLPPLPPR